MAKLDPHRALDERIKERGESYSSVSRLLSRNAAYIQQFIKRGSPAHLDDSDIAQLSVHFGVPAAVFGGDEVPESAGLSTIATQMRLRYFTIFRSRSNGNNRF